MFLTFEDVQAFQSLLRVSALPRIRRTIDHPTFPNFHSFPLYRNKTPELAYQLLHVDLDHQLKIRVLFQHHNQISAARR